MTKIEDEYHFIFKNVERSDSTLRHSIFDIRYSAVRCLIQFPTASALAQVLPSCRQGRGGRIGNVRKFCRQASIGPIE
jgi:hypothetical protein